jgi:hypothetical protein
MINPADDPAGWAALVQELDEAHEHLGALVQQMASEGRIDTEDFAVQLGHVYAHLNRAWNGRRAPAAELSNEQGDVLSRFPADLNPVG